MDHIKKNKKVLSLLAHPDDAEFLCAGTLALLQQKGWEVHIATTANGNCGSSELNAEAIRQIRYDEGINAAKIINASYHSLNCDDIFVLYDRPTIRKAIALFRRVQPDLVLTHNPTDYMLDHEITSQLAQTASFCCGMKNIEIDGVDPFEPTPYLYYLDPIEGKDRFGQEVPPTFLIDISSVIDTKEKMLCAHASQREWLMNHQGMDEYTQAMRHFSGQQGKRIHCDYAEGFRQHLGHGYRQDNILKTELNKFTHNI